MSRQTWFSLLILTGIFLNVAAAGMRAMMGDYARATLHAGVAFVLAYQVRLIG